MSRQFQKKMRSRIKWFSYIALPILGVGSIALFLQLFFFRGSSSYFRFDFNSGILWKWQEETEVVPRSVKVVQNFFPENLFPENFSSKEKFEKVFQKESFDIPTITEVPDWRKNQNETDEMAVLPENLNLASVEIESGFSSVIPGEAIKRLESSTIFNPNTECKSSNVSFGLSFAPTFNFRTLNYTDAEMTAVRYSADNSRLAGQSEKARKENDRFTVNQFFGLDIYLKLFKNFSLQTGWYWGNYGEQLMVMEISDEDPNYALAKSRKNPAFNSDPLYSPVKENLNNSEDLIPYTNKFTMWEIPLIISYNAAGISKNIDIQAGVVYGRLQSVDALVYDFQSDYYYAVKDCDFKLFNRDFLTSMAGITFNQPMSKSTQLFVNPQFRYSLTPTFTEKYPVKQNQMSALLRMGVKIHL